MKKLFAIFVLLALILLSLFPVFAEDCLHPNATETDNFCSQCGKELIEKCDNCGEKDMTVMYIVLAVFAAITVFVGIPTFLSEIGFFEYLKGKKEKKKLLEKKKSFSSARPEKSTGTLSARREK